MKRIVILGSTGSIGTNTLNVVSHLKDRFKVVGLATNSNLVVLRQQIDKFHPETVCIADESQAQILRQGLTNNHIKVYQGASGLEELAGCDNVDMVVMAISGSAALLPTIRAIKNKKTIALANKECLVMAGGIIMDLARKNNVQILPIDSEESAIFQCLNGRDIRSLKKIYLTASGGPFRTWDKKSLNQASPKEALNHPRWKMGAKVSIDSATLMNKGLEVIETKWLFGVEVSQIEVIVHKESIIHSMVEFIDGSIIAQLANTDMRLSIQYALTYPDRCPAQIERLDFLKLKNLSFQKPDVQKFPCLSLAFAAARAGGTVPAVLNAANEEAVDAFLNKKIKFNFIPKIIEKVLSKHKNKTGPSLDDILETHLWAKNRARQIINDVKN